MQSNTVQTIFDFVKDITGQDNLSEAKFMRAFNFALDHYSYLGLTSSGRWKWDSRLNNDISRVTGIVTTTGKVSLETELATIEHVEVLVNGKYKTLKPIDQRDSADALDTVYNATGTPTHYDVEGRFIRVYPLPDTSYTVRVSYGRIHPRFTTSDLSSEVGVEPMHEEYVAMRTADRVMIGVSNPTRNGIRDELKVMEDEVRDFFSKRDQDTGRKLTAKNPSVFMMGSRK